MVDTQSDGTVQQLAVHTLGGIVTPAEPLMVIVPKGAGLEIEATLANKDVGFVHKGQPVEIKVETFSFTRYGLLHGTVDSISQDAVAAEGADARDASRRSTADDPSSDEHERQAGQPSYVAHVALAATGIETEQGFSPLEPGMIRRDLVSDGACQLSEAHLAAWQGGEPDKAKLRDDLKIGDAYIEDLFSADIIVIGAPMYNFSVPSQLKSWIDRVMVARRTFRYTPEGPASLLPTGKRVFIASARGGVYTGDSPSASLDHHESYLRGLLGFLGLADVTVIRAEGLALGDASKGDAIARAKAEIGAITA